MTRRHFLHACLAAAPALAAGRFAGAAPVRGSKSLRRLVPGPGQPTVVAGLPTSGVGAATRRALGLPVPGEQWHGDSSVGAARRAGLLVEEPLPLAPWIRQPLPSWPAMARTLQQQFPDLKRHIVFEYYPWYGVNPWLHWNQGGHTPPYDVASTSMPRLGPYDSHDTSVIEQHAEWIAAAGAGAINLSWWGQGTDIDRLVPTIMDVMRAHDIHVAFHIEPYADDHAAHYYDDVMYLISQYGDGRHWDCFLLPANADGRSGPVFKSFRTIVPPTTQDCHGTVYPVPDYAPDATWRSQTDALRTALGGDFDHLTLLADSLDVGRTLAGGFDGVAIYDVYVHPDTWPGWASAFSQQDLVFSFSINGGFDGFIPTTPPDDCYVPPAFDPPVGAVDWSVPAWRFTADAAIQTRITDSAATTLQLQIDPARANARRGFFLTYVGTFNEWHEGTAFEPARNRLDLLPQEAAFGYHNPVDGAMKLEALQDLLSQILAPNAVVRPWRGGGVDERRT